MPSITIDDVTINAWYFGVEITRTNSSVKTFVAKGAIGTLTTQKEQNYCMVRYIPLHSHTHNPVELVSWYKEKTVSDNAERAYEFIVKNLFTGIDVA